MEQKQLYGIGIYEEAIVLTDFTEDHAKRFIVSQEQLMEFFKFNKCVTLEPFSGLIKMVANMQGGNDYLVQRPREKRKLIYYQGKKLIHVPMEMPNLLIKANISETGRCSIRFLGAFMGKLNNKTDIYGPALPNCTGTNMCNGGSDVTLKDKVMAAIDSAIYDTPFNHHTMLVGGESIPFLDYVKKHRGRMPFKTLRICCKAGSVLEGRPRYV